MVIKLTNHVYEDTTDTTVSLGHMSRATVLATTHVSSGAQVDQDHQAHHHRAGSHQPAKELEVGEGMSFSHN